MWGFLQAQPVTDLLSLWQLMLCYSPMISVGLFSGTANDWPFISVTVNVVLQPYDQCGAFFRRSQWPTFLSPIKSVHCYSPVMRVWLSAGTASDYEDWMPHETMKKDDPQRKGCLLGQRTVYQRLKPDSWWAINPAALPFPLLSISF